jgi:hypothetical protein
MPEDNEGRKAFAASKRKSGAHFYNIKACQSVTRP